jgi:hypothetical protein
MSDTENNNVPTLHEENTDAERRSQEPTFIYLCEQQENKMDDICPVN